MDILKQDSVESHLKSMGRKEAMSLSSGNVSSPLPMFSTVW